MADDARTGRSSNYNSPLRAKQAAATRRSIVEAALLLFGEHGWSATTLPAIAKEAGVSVDTIHAVFGTKSALLMDVVHVAIVGDDDDVAMADRDDFALLGKGRRAERIRAGVRYTLAVYDRSVPILRALREAAASDAVARERFERYDHDRRELIAAGTALMLGSTPSEEQVDAVWALISPEVRTYLLEDRGWSPEAVEDWFVHMVKAALDRR
jgi:AcrR family transcriptional regulator